MTTVNDIFSFLCALAPLELQYEFDNAGFLVGHASDEVNRVLLALDVTDEVIDEAISRKAELIVSHHPLIFTPRRNMTDEDPDGARLLRLTENRIALISMHTNLDRAAGGVNDVLLSLFGAEPEGLLDEDGCGRTGFLKKELPLGEFLVLCKSSLGTAGLRYYDAGRPVRHLAVMGGSGGESVEDAFRKGCDTYLTADLKYHQFLLAKELGVNLIDGDHFCTEAPVMPVLRDRLAAAFPELCFTVSEVLGQTVRFA